MEVDNNGRRQRTEEKEKKNRNVEMWMTTTKGLSCTCFRVLRGVDRSRYPSATLMN